MVTIGGSDKILLPFGYNGYKEVISSSTLMADEKVEYDGTHLWTLEFSEDTSAEFIEKYKDSFILQDAAADSVTLNIEKGIE